VKRRQSLRGDSCELLSVPINHHDRKDEQNKLGKELGALDLVLLGRLCLDPWSDHHQTENTNEAFDREEDEETKEDVVEGSHILFTHIISDRFPGKDVDDASAADDTPNGTEHV
jgi:hypothetical protein